MCLVNNPWHFDLEWPNCDQAVSLNQVETLCAILLWKAMKIKPCRIMYKNSNKLSSDNFDHKQRQIVRKCNKSLTQFSQRFYFPFKEKWLSFIKYSFYLRTPLSGANDMFIYPHCLRCIISYKVMLQMIIASIS